MANKKTTIEATEKPAKKAAANVFKKMRVNLDLNQHEFWSRVGVTQSGGSRYESGRKVPAPTKTVVDLAYAPAKKALEALAKLRGVTVDELIKGAAL